MRGCMKRVHLVLARYSKGWSQGQAAEYLGVTRNTLSQWERGRSDPYPIHVYKLCEMHGKTAAELDLDNRLSEKAQGEAARSRPDDHASFSNPLSLHTRLEDIVLPARQEPDISSNEALIVKRADASISEQTTQQHNTAVSFIHFTDRREAIKTIGVAGAILLEAREFFNPETWEQLSKSLTQKPSRIDKTLLDGLKETVKNYWKLRLFGSIAFPDLLQCVLWYLKGVLQLLEHPQSLSSSIGLHSIASETAQLAGVLMFDMDYRDSALSCYQFSSDIAREANNTSLVAAALGRMSVAAATQNKPSEALPLLKEAQHLARQCNAFTLCSWLVSEEAEAYAQLIEGGSQEQKACQTALEQAENFVHQIDVEEEAYGVGFNCSRLLAYQGTCYIRFHEPERALQALTAAFNSPESPAVFKRLILTDMAKASIQAGNVEQACNYLSQSLELIAQLNAMGSLGEIYQLRQRLESWSTIQAVKDVDERLRHFTGLA